MQAFCAGSAANLMIVATGTELTYQWRKGDVDIEGENSAILRIYPVTLRCQKVNNNDYFFRTIF